MTDRVAFFWNREDVRSLWTNATDEQADNVLCRLVRNHDATYGITWDRMESAIRAENGEIGPFEEDEGESVTPRAQLPATTMTAEARGLEMMLIPLGKLPPLALAYYRELADVVGSCGEVYLSAWTAYAHYVEGLPLTDDLYDSGDARAWFAANASRNWRLKDDLSAGLFASLFCDPLPGESDGNESSV